LLKIILVERVVEGPISKDKRKGKLKYREAAYRAWKTIRRKKFEAAARISKRIEEFISPERVGAIRHPETPLSTKERKKYGKGIICQFEKTPPRIACGKFWELRWAFGCPLNCAYCYLRGTNRGNMSPRYVKLNDVLRALDEVFNDPDFNDGKPALFNSGELCDSLMNPDMMAKIADKFEEQRKHKLVLVTKFGPRNAMFLVEKPRKNVVCVWSINAIKVSKLWESAAPHPEERIKAACMTSEAGYEVRVRIDPIFPVDKWKECYEDIIYMILSSFEPARIILGTPRGLWKTIFYAQKAGVDMSWSKYFEETETGWGKKIPFALRKVIYEFMYDKLTAIGFDKSNISICKETIDLLNAMKLNYRPLTCQCYGY
jgi:spore photoproduct lyase